jgi:hypothetical protein
MYLNCPSRNIYSQYLGDVELTGKPLNVWNTVSFSLTNAEVTGLLQSGYTDLTVTVVLNVPVPTTGVYFIDNLRFIPLATNACSGWPNGTSCTDGNACTQTDTCQSGVCAGANPVTCTAQDQCHTAGTCNASTGICSNPAVANGTACNDGNTCTRTDTCQSGVCQGSDAIVCPPVGNQCEKDVCDPSSGSCSVVPVANGAACNDGDACTSGDTCQSGLCGGTLGSLCEISIRFEEIVALGNGAQTAIFSYNNPGTSTVSASYGSSNFVSVNGQMVTTAPSSVPTSFAPGDHPGALSYPLPAGATIVSWTLSPHVATSSGAAKPLGTTSTGAPAVTVTNAAGSPLLVPFDLTNDDVSPGVVLGVTPSALTVTQGGQAAAILSVEYVGGFANPIGFAFGGNVGISATTLPMGSQATPSSYSLVLSAGASALLGTEIITVTAVGGGLPATPSTAAVTATIVPPVVSSVTLATLSMTAPLTLQGALTTSGADQVLDIGIDDIDGFLGGDPAIHNYTTTPIPNFLADPNAPRWAQGSGFTVQDDLGVGTGGGFTSVPKILVQSSQVNFEVNLSLTDDTSALAITATPNNFGNPPDPLNVGTGHTNCTSSLFPSVVEGNHGHYDVRVERWIDNATGCQAAETLDPDYPGVTFDGPPPDPFAGCWVPIGSNGADLYGSQPLPDIAAAGINGPSAPQDATLSTTMSIPVFLPAITTYLRYVVKLEEADTRVPTDTDVVGWGSTRRYPDAFSCEEEYSTAGFAPFSPQQIPTTGQGYACPGSVDPQTGFQMDAYVPFCPPAVPIPIPAEFANSNEGPLSHWRVTRPPVMAGQQQQQTFVYEVASNPFQVVVEPVAVAQMKVLPLTIIYQPPGDKSTATYTISQSFGLNMTASNLVLQNQSTAVDTKVTDASATGLSFKNLAGGSSGAGTPLSNLLGGLSAGVSLTDSTTWDNSTLLGTGRSLQAAESSTATLLATTTTPIGPDKSLIPGAAGTYSIEPFWDDVFLMIVHPQVGVWQANQGSSIILLGADGAPTAPALFSANVRMLDSCARQVGPNANGLLINTATDLVPGTPPTSAQMLNANDCMQLLQLDPFYGVGQSLPTAPSDRVVRAQSTVMADDYGTGLGVDGGPGEPLSPKLDQVVTYTNVMTTTNVATYNATVTDAVTTSLMNTLTLSAYGFNFAPSSTDANTTTNVTGWTVTYQASFAATVSSSIGIEGMLADDHPTAQYQPVFVFQDSAFGGFMFQDPNAPLAP